MATSITKTNLAFNEGSEFPAGALTDGTGKVAYDKDDAKILLVFENTAASSEDVTVKKGNGIQGTKDLVLSVPASKTYAVVVESGKYVNTSGSDKGKLVFTASASNIKAACIALP